MAKIRILLVEDRPSYSKMLLKRLDDPVQYKVELRTEPDGAVQLARSESFDLILIDLHLKNDSEEVFEGIDVCESLPPQLKEGAAVIMYSGWITRKNREELTRRCKAVGADEVLSRPELFSRSRKELASWIGETIQKKRKTRTTDQRVKFESDLRTLAALEAFGRERLADVVLACVAEKEQIEVRALQAGYSGAAVLRAASAQALGGPVNLVIKVTRSQFSLEDELKRRPVPGSAYDASSALPVNQHVVQQDGIYAIAIPEVRARTLLREFLLTPGLTKSDQLVLRRVVDDLLVIQAKSAKPWNVFNIDSGAYEFKATAGCEIADFLSEAATWKGVLTEKDRRAIRQVKEFIQRVLDGHWGFTMENRYAALLHGDFHCRNIFVAPDTEPQLIDFGRSEVYPRLFDFACLDVDLVLAVMDSGKGEDQGLGNVEGWFNTITESFPYGKTNTLAVGNAKVKWLRHLLSCTMTTGLDSVTRAEYAETLIFHFLRYLRFKNIPIPKKILAVRLIQALAKEFGHA